MKRNHDTECTNREKAKTKPERKEKQACVNASVVYTSRRVGEDRLVPASLLLQYILELHLLFHPDSGKERILLGTALGTKWPSTARVLGTASVQIL